MASAVFNVQADVIGGFQASSDIVKSVLTVGLSDDVHPVVVTYLDHLGNWLGASPRSMDTVRAAICMHGSVYLRKLGLMVGIKPVDTARLLADCSGGIAWLTWQAALLECYSHEDVATFQQEAGRLIGLKTIVVPHMRELTAAIGATAPRLGTVSFPEHYAKICGAMRQALFAATDLCPSGVAEAPVLADVADLLVSVAEAYKEQSPVAIRGQRSIGWLAAALTWIYDEAVEVKAAGSIVRGAELRRQRAGSASESHALISVELCEEDTDCLMLDYRVEREGLIAMLVQQPRRDSLTSFGPTRSRADEYYANWLACTSPVHFHQIGPVSAAAAQLTCGLLRTIHVTNEGGETGLRAETQGAGKQLVNVLRFPGSYSDVRRVREFFTIPHQVDTLEQATPTSQLQMILRNERPDDQKVLEGGSTTALAFLARVPSLREVYGRLIREILRIGIRGENECHCILPGSGPETWLPSAHVSHCGVYHAASLAVELVAACICNLFIEGPTSPRLSMFQAAPLRWAISKAIEQSVLTGSALISGADLIKSVLVVAGYGGNYEYGPLIVSSGGQALLLAALNDMALNPISIGRIVALPGAVLHRNQYYEKVIVGRCRSLGGDVLGSVQGRMPGDRSSTTTLPIQGTSRTSSSPAILTPASAAATPTSDAPPRPPLELPSVRPTAAGAAASIDIVLRETSADIHVVVRSRQADGTVKEHDLWHCVTAALTANSLGDCSHPADRAYTPRAGESIRLVGTGTNLSRGALDAPLVMAQVHGRGFDRLLACGVGVNMVVQTAGCIQCAVSACRQVGYSYIVL